jgi:hypothetical protein
VQPQYIVGAGAAIFIAATAPGRDAPDTGTAFPGYPAYQKAGYRTSGRKSDKGRLSDIQPDTWLDTYIFSKYQINLYL